MARQEVTSVFSDGLMMDLNPINTPKSVLTDCLNGTFITYNGNEFVLQNDMGNYKLQNCKLPTNFIPVGIKSYGDILYIVSYNPLSKEVEIGSYPAPQSIFSSGNDTVSSNDTNLKPYEIEDTVTYNKVIDDHKNPLYIFIKGADEETYKLYPGDEFSIQIDDNGGTENIFPYQHLNFYVIDENKKLYDIDDEELLQPSIDEYRYVFWETPGWLAAQYNLYTPDKFNLNIRSLNLPEFWDQQNQIELSIDLNTQTIISDFFFREELKANMTDNQFDHLKVRYKYTVSDPKKIVANQKDQDVTCINYQYQDEIITAYTNNHPSWVVTKDSATENFSGYIEVEAYPILDVSDADNVRVLEFTQFSSKQRIELNKIKDSSLIKVGKSVYKWAVDDNSCTVSFDIQGPIVNAINWTGTYELYKLGYRKGDNSGLYPDWNTVFATGNIPNLNMLGQNTIDIPSTSLPAESGIYLLRLKLKNTELENQYDFIIIPSVTFNDFFGTYDNYNTQVSMEMWVSKYGDTLNIDTLRIINQPRGYITNEDSPNYVGHISTLGVYYTTNNIRWISNASATWTKESGETDAGYLERMRKNLCYPLLPHSGSGWLSNYWKELRIEAKLSDFAQYLEIETDSDFTPLRGDLWNPKNATTYQFGDISTTPDSNQKNIYKINTTDYNPDILNYTLNFTVIPDSSNSVTSYKLNDCMPKRDVYYKQDIQNINQFDAFIGSANESWTGQLSLGKDENVGYNNNVSKAFNLLMTDCSFCQFHPTIVNDNGKSIQFYSYIEGGSVDYSSKTFLFGSNQVAHLTKNCLFVMSNKSQVCVLYDDENNIYQRFENLLAMKPEYQIASAVRTSYYDQVPSSFTSIDFLENNTYYIPINNINLNITCNKLTYENYDFYEVRRAMVSQPSISRADSLTPTPILGGGTLNGFMVSSDNGWDADTLGQAQFLNPINKYLDLNYKKSISLTNPVNITIDLSKNDEYMFLVNNINDLLSTYIDYCAQPEDGFNITATTGFNNLTDDTLKIYWNYIFNNYFVISSNRFKLKGDLSTIEYFWTGQNSNRSPFLVLCKFLSIQAPS